MTASMFSNCYTHIETVILKWSNVESEIMHIPVPDTIIEALRNSSISAMSIVADMTVPVVVYRSQQLQCLGLTTYGGEQHRNKSAKTAHCFPAPTLVFVTQRLVNDYARLRKQTVGNKSGHTWTSFKVASSLDSVLATSV